MAVFSNDKKSNLFPNRVEIVCDLLCMIKPAGGSVGTPIGALQRLEVKTTLHFITPQ